MTEASSTPLVTVGLPVRNGARSLDRALSSLLAQTEKRLEVVVSDNASTDETVAIARRHASADPRVRVHCHDRNVGITANFEHVLRLARGEYFMWAAHDDSWEPTFVESLRLALDADPAAQAAMCATRRVREDGALVDDVHFDGPRDVGRPWWRLSLEVASGSPHHLYICGLYRTAFLRAIADPLPRVAAADRLFALNLVMSARLAYCDELLYRREVSSTHLADRYPDEAIGVWWSRSGAWLRTAAALGPYLLRSPTISWWRKPFAAVLVAEYVRRRLPLRAVARGLARAFGR